MSKKKNGAVLRIEMDPTPDGWVIMITHRAPDGRGVTPIRTTLPNLDAAIEHVTTRCTVDGIETRPPSPKGRL